MTGRLEHVQRVGVWLRQRQRAVALTALGAALVVLAAGERSAVEHRALLASAVSSACVVVGIVAGPWVGLSVAIVAGAVSVAFVFPFNDLESVAAGLGAIAFWALASMGAGFISDHYRRQVAVRQREVEERQRLALALNEIGSAIASGLDRASVLPRIVRLAGESLDADAAAVLEYDEGAWRVDHAWGAAAGLAGRRVGADPDGVAGALEASRRPLAACATGEHGIRCGELAELGATAALVVPILREDDIGGALAVMMYGPHRRWTRREIDFAEKVSSDLSAALENVRLYEAQLHIATTLQEQMIHALPAIDGLEMAAVSQAAAQPELIGGDFYDVFELADGTLSLLIGDVEGKGVRAAGLTERVRTMVRALWLDSADPHEILTKANALLLGEDEDQHVTALLARVDLRDGTLEIATAGHPPPVICDGAGCGLLALRHGPPLGAFDWRYERVVARLAPGETLVLCTDGVTEARRSGDLFGEARLVETVRRHRDAPVAGIAAAVRDAALAHAGALDDDLQILVVRSVASGTAGKDTASVQRTVR
jgi:hypothetical protein